MEREKCTAVSGIQTMYVKMMEELALNRKEFSLRTGWTTGPPQTPGISTRNGRGGYHQSLRYSEASPCCSISDCRRDPLEDRLNRMGKPLPGVEMKIINPQNGESLPPGERGEICVRGWNLMQGYYKKPEETAKAIDGEDGSIRETWGSSMRRAGLLHGPDQECGPERRGEHFSRRGGELIFRHPR